MTESDPVDEIYVNGTLLVLLLLQLGMLSIILRPSFLNGFALEAFVDVSFSSAKPTSLFAVFLTVVNSSRIDILRNYMESCQIPGALSFEYWFINGSQYNDTSLRLLYPTDEDRAFMRLNPRLRGNDWLKHVDLLAKLYFSMRYFLQNSKASWFYRGVDDSIILLDNVLPYLNYLESRYDPHKDLVFKGHCIDAKWCSRLFAQGGSGYLLSRYAVEQMLPDIEWLMRTLSEAEDVSMTRLIEKHGLSMGDVTSEFFMGTEIEFRNRAVLKEGKWDKIDRCPDPSKFRSRGCGTFVSPLCDLVFVHAFARHDTDLPPRIEFIKKFTSFPPNLMWYMVPFSGPFNSLLCWAENPARPSALGR